MKSKRLLVLSMSLCLVLILALIASLSGCSSKGESQTPTTSAPPTTPLAQTSSQPTTSAPAATTPVKAITLKLAPGGLPNDQALFGAIPQWITEVEKRTQGRVKIEVYYGETLAKGRENIDALQNGIADVIFPAPHHQPGKLPLFTLGNVPGLSTDGWAKNRAFFELMTTQQAFADEWAQYGGVVIGSAYYSACGLIASSPINTLDQVKGMKISAQAPASDMLAKFGAAPLALQPAEQYDGMSKHTVDALAEPINASIDFKHYEVAKYFTFFNLGDRNHALVIAKSALNKLTPQDQKTITDFAAEYVQLAYDNAMKGSQPNGMDIMKSNGVTFLNPSADDQAKCIATANELVNKWVTEMDGKGLPGTALMAKYKELIKKYEAISPYKK